ECGGGEDEEAGPPAGGGVDPLDDWRPDRAAEALAARDDAERDSAIAVEPAGRVRHQRAEDRRVSEQADQDGEDEIELPGLGDEAGEDGAGRYRDRRDCRDRPHADTVRELADVERPDTGTDECAGVSERRDFAGPVQLERDRLERN